MPETEISLRPAESTSITRPRAPIVALLLLAPVISELLYGAIRISTIFVLIPEILTWGCGALLIREWVRRWNKGWPSMLCLGLALAVAEEWVIQQTSIAPLVGLAKLAYGRVWGVNWVYFLWALGYESVWVVLVPVQLTELLYPAQRNKLWLRTRGRVIASVAFIVGAFAAWYGWTQRARVKIFHLPPYSPPPLYLAAGCATIVLLVVAAYLWPSAQLGKRDQRSYAAPSPWMVGWIVTILATPWAAFVLLGYGSLPAVPFEVALAMGLAWSTFTLFLVTRWTSGTDWSDAHRFALVFAGTLGSMLGGFVVFKVGGALRMDWIGKAVLNAAAIAGLAAFGRKVARGQLSG